MKILQLCNKIPWPPDDGGRIAMLNLAKGFSNSRHEVFVLGMNTLKHRTSYSDIPKEISDIINFIIVDVPAKISKISLLANFLFSNQPYTGSRFYSDDYKFALIELLQKHDFDVIQLEGLYLSVYIQTIRKHSNALVSLRSHNIEHEIWQRTAVNEKSTMRRIYSKSLASRIRNYKLEYLNKYDVLIPITEKDNQKYADLGNVKPSFVSQTGIDITDYQVFNGDIESGSLFHIGALDWPPNQEGLIWFIDNVWDDMHKSNQNIKLHIAGRNAPLWLEIKFKNTSGIVYEGEVENAREFMMSKQIMIVPLLSGSGMRIKIIEGLALGKVIVSTSIGAEGIGVTDGENIIIANDEIGFQKGLSIDLKKQESISKSARNYVRLNFDNNTLSDNLCGFYKDQINKINAN